MSSVIDEVKFPADWSVYPIRAVASKISESGFEDLEPLSVFLDAGVIPRSSREDNHNQLGEDIGKYQRVLPGDIVFNKLRTWQGGFGVSSHLGIVSPAYIIARPVSEKIDGKYLGYLLKSRPYLAELTRLSKWMPPSQFDISWDSIRNIKICVPSLKEQERSSTFLDSLSQPIATLETEIKLIEEELRSVLDLEFDRLTKSCKMRPIRSHVTQCNNYITVKQEEMYDLLGVRWYGEGAFLRETVSGVDSSATKLQKVVPGTLIYNRLFAWKESFGVIPDELDGTFASGEFPMFQCSKDLRVEFLNFFLLSPRVTSLISLQSQGASSISRSRWKEIDFFKVQIPLPSLAEQDAVIVRIGKLRELLNKVRLRKKLMLEFTEAVTTELVTGRLILEELKGRK
jgi:type I restriction enzyme S subunit